MTWLAIATAVCAETAQTINGKVVGVHDGDSITVLTDGKNQIKVRLEGIDAPELGQPFGKASKQGMSDLVFGKPVLLQVTGRDRYQRTLAVVWCDRINVNLQIVHMGLAWRYDKYSKDAALFAAQQAARAARRALWADAGAVPPWEWRKRK